MQLTKLFLSLLALQQCDASGEVIAGKLVGGVTDFVVNLNPWAAGAVAVTSVSGVVWKYQG